VKRGEIYRFNLNPTVGTELRKIRLCVVVQRTLKTEKSLTTIVCPITDARGQPGDVLNPIIPAGIGGTTKDSRVVCNQIRSLDKTRAVGKKQGELTTEIMTAVSRGLSAILDLG